MIDRHKIERGQTAWVFIKNEPTEVVFGRLMPYHGFQIHKNGEIEDVNEDAVFAETREELIQDNLNRLLESVRQAVKEARDFRKRYAIPLKLPSYPRL